MPFGKEDDTINLLQHLENDSLMKEIIDDMSISNVSLEEIFIKLTGAEKDEKAASDVIRRSSIKSTEGMHGHFDKYKDKKLE